jgi:hypothetical protein
MNGQAFYDDGSAVPETVSPTPAEEVPVPYQDQTSRRGYQQMPPNGPSRTSRYPRNNMRQSPPRMTMTRRPPPMQQTEADVVPAGYQERDVFYDDAQSNSGAGYRVSTPPSNYRR